MLTREQLDHLCVLTALELSEEEKDRLLPQLSAILDFVGQLDACVVDDSRSDSTAEEGFHTTALPADEQWGPELLANIRHEIVVRMPHLKAGLVR